MKIISRILLQFVILAVCFYAYQKIRNEGITYVVVFYVILSLINISSSYMIFINSGRIFYYILICSLSLSISYPSSLVVMALANMIMDIFHIPLVGFMCVCGVWSIIYLFRESKKVSIMFYYSNMRSSDVLNLLFITIAFPVVTFVNISYFDKYISLMGSYAVLKWIIIFSIFILWKRLTTVFISCLIFFWISFYLIVIFYSGKIVWDMKVSSVIALYFSYSLLFICTFSWHVYKKKIAKSRNKGLTKNNF